MKEYSKAPPGSPRDRALIRQLRYNALNAWKVPDIVDIIPVLLHVSLALFLVGLVVFVCGQSELVFYIVLLMTSLTSAFYLFTSIISLGIWTCPYRTSAVTALRKLLSSSYRQLETEAICLNRAHGMSVSLMHDSLVWLWQHTLNPNVHSLVLNTYSGIPIIDDAFEDDDARRNSLPKVDNLIRHCIRPIDWRAVLRRCIMAGVLAMILHWGAIGSAIVYSVRSVLSKMPTRC